MENLGRKLWSKPDCSTFTCNLTLYRVWKTTLHPLTLPTSSTFSQTHICCGRFQELKIYCTVQIPIVSQEVLALNIKSSFCEASRAYTCTSRFPGHSMLVPPYNKAPLASPQTPLCIGAMSPYKASVGQMGQVFVMEWRKSVYWVAERRLYCWNRIVPSRKCSAACSSQWVAAPYSLN